MDIDELPLDEFVIAAYCPSCNSYIGTYPEVKKNFFEVATYSSRSPFNSSYSRYKCGSCSFDFDSFNDLRIVIKDIK